MTVVIAGAAGYVGRRLLQKLDAADGYDLPSAADGADGVSPGDFRDDRQVRSVLADADHLIHLAAVSGVQDCADRPSRAVRQNIETLATAARACVKTDTHLVFPSSQAIHGDSFYGATKAIGEDLITAVPGLDWTVLEFSNIYGRYSVGAEYVQKSTVVDAFVNLAAAGKPLTVHEPGTQQRNFIHIDDVADAYDAALDARGRHVVTGPDTLSILELAECVAEQARVDIELVETDRPAATIDAPDPKTTLPGFGPSRTVDQYVRQRLLARAAG